MGQSNVVNLLHEFLHRLLLNYLLLHSASAPQECLNYLVSWNLILKSMVQNVLSCWVLLDSLDVSWNWNAQVLELNSYRGQRLYHLCFIMS